MVSSRLVILNLELMAARCFMINKPSKLLRLCKYTFLLKNGQIKDLTPTFLHTILKSQISETDLITSNPMSFALKYKANSKFTILFKLYKIQVDSIDTLTKKISYHLGDVDSNIRFDKVVLNITK